MSIFHDRGTDFANALLEGETDETTAMLAMIMASMAQVEELREIKDHLAVYLSDITDAIGDLTAAVEGIIGSGTPTGGTGAGVPVSLALHSGVPYHKV